MAGPNINNHGPIIPVMNRANTAPLTKALAEVASSTFKFGTPVQNNGSGFARAWDGTTITAGIMGFAESFGQNLSSSGKGAPGYPFGPIGPPGAIQTYGSVPNEASAVNIALGTPIADGRTLYVAANDDNVFQGVFDNSTGTVAADYTPVQADIGASYGLTVDTSGFWYVDKGKTGGSAVLQIVGINPLDGFIVNARVLFKILPASQQPAASS
jgi:hypothetical protein